MKKYFQITIALGILGLFVIIKQIKGDNSTDLLIIDQNIGSLNKSTQESLFKYRDGKYTGSVEDAFYGNIQVQVIITSGKISDVTFIQYADDNPTSLDINKKVIPILKRETITAQSENINGVSGASFTSPAYKASLAEALNQAK